MKLLIVHNQLWSHYKAKIFSELHLLSDESFRCKVLQIGLYEASRANLGNMDEGIHQYEYEVLFRKSLEEIHFLEKTTALIAAIHAYQPNVLNLTGYYDPALWLVLLYAKSRGIRVVLSNESTAQDHARKSLKERLKSVFIKNCDGFFCFGSKAAQYMIDLGAKSEQILVKNAAVVDNNYILNVYQKALPNVAITKQKLSLPRYNFIFVGRLVSVKNLPFLLKCFRQVFENEPDWGLILLGNGELKSSLEQQVINESIGNVNFIEGVSWHEVPAYLALADVLVLPSTSETWGLVVNEAQVCGLPVVVSDQCGCAEDLVSSTNTGFVFESGNEEALMEIFSYICRNTDTLGPMGENAQGHIQRYSPTAAALAMRAGIGRFF